MSLTRDHRKSAPSLVPPEKRLSTTTEAASIATSSTSSRRSSSHFSGDSPEGLLPSLVAVPTTTTAAAPSTMETRHNRRSNSDIPISVQTGAFRSHAQLPPPNRRAPMPPPSPVHQRPSRRLSPSHSGNPSYAPPQQLPYGMPPPSSPVYYSRGAMGPPSPDERQPLLFSNPASRSSQHQSHQQQSRQQYSSRHRKSLSSSAAEPGSYGAFWNDPPQSSHGFSPAADLRQLGLSPTASQSRKQHHLLMPSNSWKGEAQSERWQPPSRRHQYHVRQLSVQQRWVQDTKGVAQPLACRNVFFLLLFVFHLIFLLFYWGPRYAPNALVDNTGYTYTSLIAIAGWAGVFAMAVSALLLGFMTYWASHFIQIALFAMITLSFIWGTIGIGVSPKTIVPVTGVIALALAVAYTFIVWDRIPFASANLATALSGLRDCPSIVAVALFFQLLAGIYAVSFSLVVFGFYDEATQQSLNWSPHRLYTVYSLLLLSFAWTLQVIQSTVQAITAAVIHQWWHSTPADRKPSIVRESCFNTIFYSMGSICFGSLCVGPVRCLRFFFVFFRPSSSESSSLMCLEECVHYIQSCVTFCVDSLVAKCNVWAYTYIGMYHYGFLDAGKHATELFEKRGWSTIVSDDLVPNVLFLTSLVIGGITGCFAYLLSQLDQFAEVHPRDENGLAPFVEGVIMGLVLTSIFFSLISSSVNAVLVCFASSPLDFELRHPELSHNMRTAWREVWPRSLLDVEEAIPWVTPPVPSFLSTSMRGDLSR